MKAQSEIDRLAAKYRKHGVSAGLILDMVGSGICRGISDRAALAGVRLALGSEYGEEEYFSTEDVAAMLCTTPAEATALMMEHMQHDPEAGPVVSIDARALELLRGGGRDDV